MKGNSSNIHARLGLDVRLMYPYKFNTYFWIHSAMYQAHFCALRTQRYKGHDFYPTSNNMFIRKCTPATRYLKQSWISIFKKVLKTFFFWDYRERNDQYRHHRREESISASTYSKLKKNKSSKCYTDDIRLHQRGNG